MIISNFICPDDESNARANKTRIKSMFFLYYFPLEIVCNTMLNLILQYAREPDDINGNVFLSIQAYKDDYVQQNRSIERCM